LSRTFLIKETKRNHREHPQGRQRKNKRNHRGHPQGRQI